MILELKPIFSKQKSFNNKAHTYWRDGLMILYSFGFPVACVEEDGTLKINRRLDKWDRVVTLRHIKEFNMQFGSREPLSKAEIELTPMWKFYDDDWEEETRWKKHTP